MFRGGCLHFFSVDCMDGLQRGDSRCLKEIFQNCMAVLVLDTDASNELTGYLERRLCGVTDVVDVIILGGLEFPVGCLDKVSGALFLIPGMWTQYWQQPSSQLMQQPMGPVPHQLQGQRRCMKRPCLSSAGTTEDWQYFKSRWSDYVKATKIDGTDKIIQLLECCDEQLRKDLTRTAGGTLTGMTEDVVFTAMRSLAVREENTMVARVTLHNMKQDRDEPVRAYGARLRGQASVCKFTQKCTGCDAYVDYTNTMLRDVLCRGLGDSEIQMDLLGNKNQDMSLEEVLRFVEAKETGKKSASRLLLPHAADAAANSSYRRQKKTAMGRAPPKDQELYTYYGSRGHGRKAPTRVRRKECPAFGTTCGHCCRDHHYEKMCRDLGEGEHENAIFDSLHSA